MNRWIIALLALLAGTGDVRADAFTNTAPGNPTLRTISSNHQLPAIMIGPFTGSALVPPVTYGLVGIGPGALGMATNVTAETIAIGPRACGGQVSGFGNTCLGEAAMAVDDASYTVAVGVDVMRDVLGSNASTTVGGNSFVDGSGTQEVIVGSLSFHGSAGTLQISGTPTTGDILRMIFATGSGSTTGVGTASYTVVGGDTLTTIATGIGAAVNALGIAYQTPQPTGATFDATALSTFTGFDNATPQNTYVGLHIPGSPTLGAKLSFTTSCTGTCTETLTVLPETTSHDNVVVGYKVLQSPALTTGSFNTLLGNIVAQNATTTFNSNVAIGYQALGNATTDNQDVVIGALAGVGNTGASNNVEIGYKAGFGLTIGSNNTIVGPSAGSTACITSGTQNVELGNNACTNNTTSNGQLSIQNAIYGQNNTGGGATMSTGQVGIAVKAALGATLVLGDAGGTSTWGSHLGIVQTTKPVLSACGTTPTQDATASDAAGIITEGTTATGCVSTFNKAFNTAPHCVISSPNGAAFTSYSASTTALTIVNASASGNQYAYVCVQ
jgi:hypothetical protein